ncbi:MAG TPA: STAS domain-containing protein [Pseudonocardiaceae bacterium]|jgi:anti-anti-sigma factor|nr:STAS domain-containing protein [Pseudonocardiaceae bacterium]
MVPDLELRVHAPIPEVVIVRVSGTVNRLTAAVFASRVGHQIGRAPHVVVDLGEVTAMDPGALAVLRMLHQRADVNGTEIHLARAEHDAVRHAVRFTGLDQLFTLDSTADAVIAGLPRQATSPDGLRRSRSNQPDV